MLAKYSEARAHRNSKVPFSSGFVVKLSKSMGLKVYYYEFLMFY
jgi:hypothetical protein